MASELNEAMETEITQVVGVHSMFHNEASTTTALF